MSTPTVEGEPPIAKTGIVGSAIGVRARPAAIIAEAVAELVQQDLDA